MHEERSPALLKLRGRAIAVETLQLFLPLTVDSLQGHKKEFPCGFSWLMCLVPWLPVSTFEFRVETNETCPCVCDCVSHLRLCTNRCSLAKTGQEPCPLP